MNASVLLKFLKALKKNNNREWFQANKKTYDELKNSFQEYVQEAINALVPFDPTLKNLEAKNCIFRINRDIRFSPDKTPYKLNFSASINKHGKKSPGAGYYLHIEPNDKSFLAGGVYMPESQALHAIREGIDYDATSLTKILSEKSFKKYFGKMEGEKLKNPPKGFPKDHPNLELLKFKSFIITHALTDEDLLSAKFSQKVTHVFQAMHPFIEYLNRAVEHDF